MAQAFLDPNADGSPLDWTPSTGSTHHNLIAKGVYGSSPTSAPASNPSTATYLSDDNTGDIDTFTFSGVPQIDPASPVSSITVWIYAQVVGGIELSVAINSLPAQATEAGSPGWYSVTFTPGGGFSQTDLNDLQLQIIVGPDPELFLATVYAAYVAFSYTPKPPPATPTLSGFGYTNNGVPGNSLSWV